jgi:hypothetical protein
MTDTNTELVAEPAGLDVFCDLASSLFALDELGGPLHVHLDDHNTELLVGDEARNTIAYLTRALARIGAGDIPTEATKFVPNVGWPEGHQVHDTAYYYGHPDWASERHQPLEQLRIAIKILTITESWSEEQAEAAYAVWQRRGGDIPCGCHAWPAGFDEVAS